MTIEITVPDIKFLVQLHHDQATEAIAAMSPSRAYGAETNLSNWRRLLTAFNLDGDDGYAFTGHNLQLGAIATVPAHALLLSVDSSWAKAKWYAGRYVSPLERWATLYIVEDAGLKQLMATNSRRWASKVLGFLATNPSLCDRAGLSVSTTNVLRA